MSTFPGYRRPADSISLDFLSFVHVCVTCELVHRLFPKSRNVQYIRDIENAEPMGHLTKMSRAPVQLIECLYSLLTSPLEGVWVTALEKDV